jgi:hypothetical protein
MPSTHNIKSNLTLSVLRLKYTITGHHRATVALRGFTFSISIIKYLLPQTFLIAEEGMYFHLCCFAHLVTTLHTTSDPDLI